MKFMAVNPTDEDRAVRMMNVEAPFLPSTVVAVDLTLMRFTATGLTEEGQAAKTMSVAGLILQTIAATAGQISSKFTGVGLTEEGRRVGMKNAGGLFLLIIAAAASVQKMKRVTMKRQVAMATAMMQADTDMREGVVLQRKLNLGFTHRSLDRTELELPLLPEEGIM